MAIRVIWRLSVNKGNVVGATGQERDDIAFLLTIRLMRALRRSTMGCSVVRGNFERLRCLPRFRSIAGINQLGIALTLRSASRVLLSSMSC